MLNVSRVYLVGLWVEAVLWGMNILLVMSVAHILKTTGRKLHWILLPSCVAMFMLATTQAMLSLTQLIRGFTGSSAEDMIDGAQSYFGGQNLLRSIQYWIYETSCVLTDSLFIWRLYVVYGSEWKIVVIPIILESVDAGCAYAACVFLALPGGVVSSPVVQKMGLVAWTCNVVINVTVPCVIAYRLMCAERRVTAMGGTFGWQYTGAMRAVLESGLIYATATLAMFILYVAGNGRWQGISAAGVPALTQLGILVPLIIVTRAGLGLVGSMQESMTAFECAPLQDVHHELSYSRDTGSEVCA